MALRVGLGLSDAMGGVGLCCAEVHTGIWAGWWAVPGFIELTVGCCEG